MYCIHGFSQIWVNSESDRHGCLQAVQVILLLRKRGLRVNGLWSIPGLPNFADGTYYDPYVTMGKQHVVCGLTPLFRNVSLCKCWFKLSW